MIGYTLGLTHTWQIIITDVVVAAVSNVAVGDTAAPAAGQGQ